MCDRVIFHIDCNKFFASVECSKRPEIAKLPVAVGGSAEKRHGIILSANETATGYGVKTAEAIWQAKTKCPHLIVIPPNYSLYTQFSDMARKIYCEYTDFVEPFGLDECWLDLTGNVKNMDEATELANIIRLRIKNELGITVSVGVSWNKVFAKLGSDYKKPDAVTVFSKENYRTKIFPLPVHTLLYVGPSTEKKLISHGIFTIGDIAESSADYLCSFLGKNGSMLHSFAAGEDTSAVLKTNHTQQIKSISNSVTTPHDLTDNDEVKLTFTALSDTVAYRIRKQGLACRKIAISVRNRNLEVFTKQIILPNPTASSLKITQIAMKLFNETCPPPFCIRSLGISTGNFCNAGDTVQFDIFGEVKHNEKIERLEKTVDTLKYRFGNNCIKSAAILCGEQNSELPLFENSTPHIELCE